MPKNKKKNVLVITYWSFNDALVQTYTLPYVKMIKKNLPKGSKIFLTTFEQTKYKITKRQKHDFKHDFKQQNINLIFFKYFNFGYKACFAILFSLFRLLNIICFHRIKTIHCFAPPAGIFGLILQFFTRRIFIIDSFEPHAEAMVENGTWPIHSSAFKIQLKAEKKISQKADIFIATSAKMKNYAEKNLSYNEEGKPFFVKPAGVNMDFFRPDLYDKFKIRKELEIDASFIGIYSGKIGGIYLEDEVFDFLRVCFSYWKNEFFFIMLTSSSKKLIEKKLIEMNIPVNRVKIMFVNHSEVPKLLSIADFAINPVKPVPTKRFCTPIKDGEYWAMGLPVIITKNISDDSDIIEQNNIGYVLKDLNDDEYLNALKTIEKLIEKQEVKDKIIAIAKKYRSFEIAETIYKSIYS